MHFVFRFSKLAATAIFSLLIFPIAFASISAGKAIYGQVTEVRSGSVVTLDHGAGRYDIRIAGIDVPTEEPLASAAKLLAASLVLGKKVRLIFISRMPNGEMLGRLDTDDPASGIKDVALELVKAG